MSQKHRARIPAHSSDPTALANVDKPHSEEKLAAMLDELAPRIEAAEKAGHRTVVTPAGHLRIDL